MYDDIRPKRLVVANGIHRTPTLPACTWGGVKGVIVGNGAASVSICAVCVVFRGAVCRAGSCHAAGGDLLLQVRCQEN